MPINFVELTDKMLKLEAPEASTDVTELFSNDGPPPASMNGDRPQSIDDLSQIMVSVYDLSTSQAMSAGIPVIGTIGRDDKRRVIVQEWCASKDFDEGNERLSVGYAIRLSVTISERKRDIGIRLPFLAAGVQLSRIEAQWQLQVIGLAGPKIQEAIVPPSDFNVERYVDAMRCLHTIAMAATDPTTTFHPETIKRVTLNP